ncbi:Fic family protein [Candidatus Woesearchaeota archaeon]|nr:Fic family protein [Candidatus Woesearchaeota archaeon]
MLVEELTSLNKKFSEGKVINKPSLEFAESAAKRTKNWQKQAAFVIRAIVADRPFEDGNKRTAAAYLSGLLEEYKIPYDPFKIDKLVLTIAKDTKSIEKIRRMIKNAIH